MRDLRDGSVNAQCRKFLALDYFTYFVPTAPKHVHRHYMHDTQLWLAKCIDGFTRIILALGIRHF